MASNTTLKRTVTMKSEVINRLEKQAENENRNFSNMVETAALSYLKQSEGSGI